MRTGRCNQSFHSLHCLGTGKPGVGTLCKGRIQHAHHISQSSVEPLELVVRHSVLEEHLHLRDVDSSRGHTLVEMWRCLPRGLRFCLWQRCEL